VNEDGTGIIEGGEFSDLEVYGNVTFTFRDQSFEVEMTKRKNYWVLRKYSSSSIIFYFQVMADDSLWKLDFSIDRDVSFQHVVVSIDEEKQFSPPILPFKEMIMRDFKCSLDTKSYGFDIKFELSRNLLQSDKVFVWILAPDLQNQSIGIVVDQFETREFSVFERYQTISFNGTIASVPGKSDEISIISVRFTNVSDAYDFVETHMNGRIDQFFYNAQLYLLEYSNKSLNSTSNNPTYNSSNLALILEAVFGTIGCIIIIGLGIYAIRKYLHLRHIKNLRTSTNSAILGEDDDSFTIHSVSTISTQASLYD
jgi:hypothetical protein